MKTIIRTVFVVFFCNAAIVPPNVGGSVVDIPPVYSGNLDAPFEVPNFGLLAPPPYSVNDPSSSNPNESPDISTEIEKPPVVEVPNAQLVRTLEAMTLENIIEFTWSNQKYREYIGSKIMPSKFHIDIERFVISKRYPFRNIGITDIDVAFKFVKLFCKWVTRLDFVSADFNDDEKSKQLLVLINQECPNLVEANLPLLKWGYLIKTPLNKVKRAVLKNEFVNSYLIFNTIYPNMEELQIENIEAEHPTYLGQLYPNLKNVTYSLHGKAFEPTLLDYLFKSNPQISSVNVEGKFPFEFFQKVSTKLPNLKTFIFDPYPEFFTQPNGPLYFNSVRNLAIRNWNNEVWPSFTFKFNRLETLGYYQIGYIEDFRHAKFNWLTTLNTKYLRELTMPSIILSVDAVNQLSYYFPNLDTVLFRMTHRNFGSEFGLFMRNTKINSITIRDVTSEQRLDIARNMPRGWNIKLDIEREAYMSGTLYMERKSN